MTEYLIRTGDHSAGLIEARHLELVSRCDDPDDPMTIAKRFEAQCSCAAAQVFADHQDHGPYDMYFCKEDAAADDPALCPHYAEQLALLEAR